MPCENNILQNMHLAKFTPMNKPQNFIETQWNIHNINIMQLSLFCTVGLLSDIIKTFRI